MNKIQLKQWWIFAGVVFAISLILRCWQITTNQFLFYDEGMYLGYNRNFLNLVADNPPKNIHELFIILGLMVKASLGTAKALWFFVLNLRVFFVGPEDWYFARVISMLAGIGTVVLTYFLAFRYFNSKRIAILSAVFLSILPSHIFYSRLGMQESLSTLIFTAALYIYLFYRSKSWGAVVTGILLSCVFLTNYRMIIAPIFILAIEMFESFKNHEKYNWKSPLIVCIVFGVIILVVGSLYEGINRYVTFGWMTHQAQEAEGQRSILSFLSYPYYVFALEGLLFFCIFWGNTFFIARKQWSKLLPFFLVVLQMGIFSLAAEKGARYLCVVLPCMAIAGAVAFDYLYSLPGKEKIVKVILVLLCLNMTFQSLRIVIARTEYAQAVKLILDHDPDAKIVSTQAVLEQLFIQNENNLKECPKNLADFVDLYRQGYQYLILDPQAYISWTKDRERFSPPLIDFLEIISQQAVPLATLNHLNPVLLKRFVLDHNQNLGHSISFLQSSTQNKYGQIRIYHMEQCLQLLKSKALSKI